MRPERRWAIETFPWRSHVREILHATALEQALYSGFSDDLRTAADKRGDLWLVGIEELVDGLLEDPEPPIPPLTARLPISLWKTAQNRQLALRNSHRRMR